MTQKDHKKQGLGHCKCVLIYSTAVTIVQKEAKLL